jgi:hypothetical protein
MFENGVVQFWQILKSNPAKADLHIDPTTNGSHKRYWVASQSQENPECRTSKMAQ